MSIHAIGLAGITTTTFLLRAVALSMDAGVQQRVGLTLTLVFIKSILKRVMQRLNFLLGPPKLQGVYQLTGIIH